MKARIQRAVPSLKERSFFVELLVIRKSHFSRFRNPFDATQQEDISANSKQQDYRRGSESRRKRAGERGNLARDDWGSNRGKLATEVDDPPNRADARTRRDKRRHSPG